MLHFFLDHDFCCCFWRSPGSNLRPLVYKASDLSTAPQRLHYMSVKKHAHPPRIITVLYSLYLLASRSFEFEICISFYRKSLHYFPLREDSSQVLAWALHGQGNSGPAVIIIPPLPPTSQAIIKPYTLHVLGSQSFKFEICIFIYSTPLHYNQVIYKAFTSNSTLMLASDLADFDTRWPHEYEILNFGRFSSRIW